MNISSNPPRSTPSEPIRLALEPRTVPTASQNAAFPRMISDFLRQRAAHLLPPRDLERLRLYRVGLVRDPEMPPSRGARLDWARIAQMASVDPDLLRQAAEALTPGVEALRRDVAKNRKSEPAPRAPAVRVGQPSANPAAGSQRAPKKHRRPVDPNPEPTELVWVDPDTFTKPSRFTCDATETPASFCADPF